MKTAFVFPGQGSQYPGMGRSIAEASAAARETYRRISAAAGFDVAKLCFEGSEEDLRRTDNTQIAIFAASMATLAALLDEGWAFDGAAGHSLGEYSALCALGVFDMETAAKLVRKRGELMEQARAGAAHAMTAVIGLDEEIVVRVCQEEPSGGGVVANYNSPSQAIISGDATAVEAVGERLKAAGAKRVLPLNVGAAFHSPLMQPAKEEMEKALLTAMFSTPRGDFIPNVSATLTRDPNDIRRNLLAQITAPVKWRQTVNAFWEAGYRRFVEVGPKKALCGLIRQCSETAECINVEEANQLSRPIWSLDKAR